MSEKYVNIIEMCVYKQEFLNKHTTTCVVELSE